MQRQDGVYANIKKSVLFSVAESGTCRVVGL